MLFMHCLLYMEYFDGFFLMGYCNLECLKIVLDCPTVTRPALWQNWAAKYSFYKLSTTVFKLRRPAQETLSCTHMSLVKKEKKISLK